MAAPKQAPDLAKANTVLSLSFLGSATGSQPGKPQTPSDAGSTGGQRGKRILIGERGDVLAKFRIPIETNHVDYALQLPEGDDSSNFSSDENVVGETPEANGEESKDKQKEDDEETKKN